MDKVADRMEKIADYFLTGKIGAAGWLVVFLAIVTIRLFLDKFVARSVFSAMHPEMDLHNYLFFGLTFLLIWLWLSLILKIQPRKLAFLMIWACLLIDWPPVFDLIKTGGAVFAGPYLYGSLEQLKME